MHQDLLESEKEKIKKLEEKLFEAENRLKNAKTEYFQKCTEHDEEMQVKNSITNLTISRTVIYF